MAREAAKQYHFTFILNPISGGRDKSAFAQLIQQHVTAEGKTYTLEYTNYKGHAEQLAARAASNAEVVVAVGGDGTVHEVINGLFGRDIPMGIIPMGSGNGLARDLGIPISPLEALEHLLIGHVTRIDVGQVLGRVFSNSFSLGKVAQIAHEFDKTPIRGMTGYLICIIKNLFRPTPMQVRIEIDGKEVEECRIELLDIMNISEFGNHLRVAPHASAIDGHLHLQRFDKFPWYRLPGWALCAFLGIGIRSKHFNTVPFMRLRIQHTEHHAQCDGEAITITPGILDIGCLPRHFPLITPRRQ